MKKGKRVRISLQAGAYAGKEGTVIDSYTSSPQARIQPNQPMVIVEFENASLPITFDRDMVEEVDE